MMRDALGAAWPLEELAAGESMTLPARHLAFVFDGHLTAHLDGFYDRMLRPDDLVGIEPDVETVLRALTPSKLALLAYDDLTDGSQPALMALYLELAERRVRELVDTRDRIERDLDDFLDETTGSFAPAPYVATQARLVLLVLEDASLAAELPAPLRRVPGLEDRVMLVWSHYPAIGPQGGPQSEYEEVALFVPCLDIGGGGPGLFCPALFPESMMAIITGREAFQFPKRYASVSVGARDAHFDAGDLQALATWLGTTDLSDHGWATELSQAIFGDGPETGLLTRLAQLASHFIRPALRTRTPLPIYVRARRGEVNAGRTELISDELIWIPFDLEAAHHLRRLDGVELSGFGRLAFARLVGGWEAVVDVELRAGQATRDLRKTPQARLRNLKLRSMLRWKRLWSLLPL